MLSLPTKKWINIGLLTIYVVLVLIIVPAPVFDKLDDYVSVNNNQWKFIVVEEGQYTKYYGSNFPVFGIERYGTMHIITTPETEAYIEAKINVPQRADTFSYSFSSNLYSYTTLIDSKGNQHTLNEITSEENKRLRDWDGSRRLVIKEFDISQFKSQNVTIRIQPTAAPSNAKPSYSYHHYYRLAKINNKQYTINEYFLLFLNIVKNIILFSLIIGFIMGYSGLSLFVRLSNNFHILIKEKFLNLFSNEDKWYIKMWYFRYYLKIVFSITNKSLDFADKIHNIKLRTSIKTSIMVGLPVIVIYTTAIIVYFIIVIILAILMLALIIWIISSLLGGSPSGGSIGGGGGSGGGGGKDYTTKYGKTYDPKTGERVVKQDGKTYRRGSIFELDAGWHADKEWTGSDKVERDWDGSPKMRRDVTGKQIIEGDSLGDPIIEPESERDK